MSAELHPDVSKEMLGNSTSAAEQKARVLANVR